MRSSATPFPLRVPSVRRVDSHTSFEKKTQLPPLIAYKIRPHQVAALYDALQTALPKPGSHELNAAKLIKPVRYDTQVLLAVQDLDGTPRPQSALMVSFGKGSQVRVHQTNAAVNEKGEGWLQWTMQTAEKLGLRRINLPQSIFLEDLRWVLRAYAAREREDYVEHYTDAHLIKRTERYFADIVCAVREVVWVETSMLGKHARVRQTASV